MGLLEQMRSSSDSTGMQVVLVLVVLAFIGIYAVPQGERSATVAEVNGTKIMDTEFSQMYVGMQREREQRLQRTLDESQRQALREEVKTILVNRELLLQKADELGVYVSNHEVGMVITKQFVDKEGSFSEKAYQRYLKSTMTSEGKFEERLRDDLRIGKVQELATLGVTLNDRTLRDEYVKSNTQVELELVEIRPTRMERDVEVSEADVNAWLADEDNASVVKQAYDDDFDRLYNRPERVRFRMIRLAVDPVEGPNKSDLVALLNQVRAEADAGADFAELAKKWSEDPSALQGGDTGVREVALLAAQDASALDGLEVGKLTKVYPTETDVRVLKLEERFDKEVDDLEAVQADIAERLIRKERANEQANEARRDLLAKWSAAGELPQDVLEQYNLSSKTTGLIPTYQQGLMGPPQPILDWSRTAEVDSVRPDAYEEGGTWTLAKLVSREEPDMAEFESNKDKEREALLLQRRQAFLSQYIQGLRDVAVIR